MNSEEYLINMKNIFYTRNINKLFYYIIIKICFYLS